MILLTPTGTEIHVTPGRRWSDGNWHWTGNETVETLAAHKYTVIPDPLPVQPTDAELAAQAAAARLDQAKFILSDPDARDAVVGVLAAVAAVAALNVDISDWSFQGIARAAQDAAGRAELPTRLDILTAAFALSAAWSRVVYHAGSFRQADELWPYLYDLVQPAE